MVRPSFGMRKSATTLLSRFDQGADTHCAGAAGANHPSEALQKT
jgi:hypothetical protein